MVAVNKKNLSNIGKYGVLSELFKRDLSASIVSNRCNNIAIKHKDGSQSIAVVRATKTDRFVTHFFDERYHDKNNPVSYWIFCKIDDDNISHYYVLTHSDVDKIQTVMNDNNRSIPSGGVDCIDLIFVKSYENRWDLITDHM